MNPHGGAAAGEAGGRPSGRGDDPREAVGDLVGGLIRFSALYAFVSVGGPEALADGPLSGSRTAARCGCDPVLMRRLLRHMQANGIVSGCATDEYRLTEAGRLLLPDVPGSMRAGVLLMGSAPWRQAFAALPETVCAGRPQAFDQDDSPYRHLARDPALAAVFDRYMVDRGVPVAEALAARDHDGVATVVDLGGGHGAMLAAVLRRHPAVTGVLVERDDVAVRAERYLREQGLSERCRVVAGDLFAMECPPGERIILSSILHNWGDEDCATVLGLVRGALEAAGPASELWCVEGVLPRAEAEGPHRVVDLDLTMAALFEQGRERTLEQYRELMERAGLRLTAAHPVPGSVQTLMTARAAGGAAATT
ncbi:methyltransferase [Spirillospora sp. CA-253888]